MVTIPKIFPPTAIKLFKILVYFIILKFKFLCHHDKHKIFQNFEFRGTMAEWLRRETRIVLL